MIWKQERDESLTQDEPTGDVAGNGRTFVLVGHCMPDQFMLKSAVKRAVDGAVIEVVNDHGSLAAHLHSQAVLLVNRVLDGVFDTRCGIELIGRVVNGAESPVCLLISNYDDAQQQAIAAGARPGFGKSALYGAEMATRLRDAVQEG